LALVSPARARISTILHVGPYESAGQCLPARDAGIIEDFSQAEAFQLAIDPDVLALGSKAEISVGLVFAADADVALQRSRES
jgi:hypothetical protein